MPVQGQSFDLLIKGGHVIDPKNEINAPMDVAIHDNVIAKVSGHIPAADAEKVIDATGYYVTPGLIDIHAHVFAGSRTGMFADGFNSVDPDDFSFRTGVTTIVDAGTSGWRNFPLFKENVIDHSRTRVLAFLNIRGEGLTTGSGTYDIDDMDIEKALSVIEEYPDFIVGSRVGHYLGNSRVPIDHAIEVARRANKPMLLECHLPQYPLEELLEKMSTGDIFTHAFGDVHDRTSILDENNRIRDYVLAAQQRGILFDVGHGGSSFHYSVAFPAMEQGLIPDSFGTDLHRFSMNSGMKNMLNIMSKYLNMGMSLDDLILRATWKPAQSIQRDDLGHLSEGAVADVTILSMQRGQFGFLDADGYRLNGDRKLEAELTVREGRIVWDLNGISAPLWNEEEQP
ncbi:MAG: amidohydrolase/deacetylase family metallohydrolase [Balneolales bacterium]